ncbi:MAG: DUF4886 domain-containing protein, partial [Oscillospiraceae bacterium]|nr:DUF4886 domain-containing protein [Oscillospiraceae bacterium]
QNSTHSAFPTYNKDQMTMYNAIISAVQNKIVTNGNFDFIIPNGTAVQNSRTSLLGDTTTRDGYHMSNDYGRYLTGLAFVKTVTGLDISGVKYAPSGVDGEEKAIAIESVNNACAKPFEVTKSAYTNEIPEDFTGEGYILLEYERYVGAYWQPQREGRYNELHYDMTNSNKYFATPRFTKDELPVGSIIVLESGWKYRPDGWVKDELQTGTRESNTTKAVVEVTEEWWGDYTLRAFNVSKVAMTSLLDVPEAEIRAAFKIYVPKEAKTVKQLVDGFDAVSSIQPGDSRLYDAHNTVSPLIFENLKLFENTAITGINLFVTGTIVDNGDTNANDPEIDDNTEYTFDISVIDSSSVKVGGKYSIKKTYTLTVKGSEIKKNDWNTFDVSHLGITVEEGETLGFGSGSSTLEFFYLGKNITSKLNYFGHNTTTGDTTLRLRTTSNLPIGVEGYSTKEPEIEDPKALKGKTLSVLGASISTYAGVSNGAAADTTNSTIRNNAKYYPNNTVKDVALNDTWWNQLASDMDLRLLVNNSWSGGAILLERAGTVGAYVDRCVQLHDNTGENAGEEPDIIVIQKGFNDFSYGKSTLGAGQVIDYDALILENGYGTPKTTMEATVIMLDKITKRYPNAEIYMFTHFKRVGQSSSDTALMEKLNKSIEEVCEKFGVNVVDLYSVLGPVEFVGDGSLHPNRLGMDVMTEAVKRSLVTNTAYEVETHIVSFELDGVTADYGDDKIVVSGKSFSANLASERDMLEVSVTMDGRDITSSAYKNGRVDIESVTGDVVINAKSTHEPQNYRWEFNGTDLAAVTGENTLTKNAGTTTNGVFDKTRYALEKSVYLLHNEPWTVEWKSEGTFKNTSGSGARVFTTDDVNANYNARYIFKSNVDWLIAMGEKNTTGSHNYGIALADYGIDGSVPHTYRLENRIAADGSNMVWLYVDGKEIGSLTNYYVGTTDKNTTSDWLSGKDFVFPYMGTDSHGFTNAKIDYIAVWEAGKPEISDFTGKTISILGDSISTYAGISNNTAYNSTIGENAVYYSEGDLGGFEQTWWQQAIDALGMELCVNNSWSGSTVLHTRSGTVGAYVDRAVQLHNDKTGEIPDVIAVFMGTNDYSYYQSKLGTADIDYSVLIKENADGSFAYANPTNTCEAYAIMLHKMVNRYPDAEIYCMGLLPRRNPDYDGKDVVPAPTEFNAQLKKVIEHFGCIYVDIESPISAEGAEFDKYIGDKRVHPNAAGMDKMTEALLSTMLGEKTAIYGIEYDMQNANPDTSAAAVIGGKEFFANISAAKDCNNLSVTVTMGGKDITAEVCKDGKISISSVTGDIIISAVAERPAKDFRWEFDGTNLVSVSADENKLTKLGGTTENGILKNTYYSLEEAVMLYHNKEWTVEFKASGSWSGMLFSSEKSSAADGNAYMFKTTTTSGLVAFGERYSSQYHNYGVPLTAIGVDTTKEHTYRIENRVAPDGTNMAYLFVDGTEYGAMNEYYINGSENQNKKIDWISGKDFVFSYIGAASHTINNCELDYIAVWENAEKSQPISMQYDDRMDISGKTVEIVDSGESVVAVEENYLRATGVGTAKVRIDGVLYAVTVEKAKINIVTIMGQSNAGNHFANATSDVVCPPGTAYWWKN